MFSFNEGSGEGRLPLYWTRMRPIWEREEEKKRGKWARIWGGAHPAYRAMMDSFLTFLTSLVGQLKRKKRETTTGQRYPFPTFR